MDFLNQYGVRDIRRERLIRRAILIVLSVGVVAGFLYFWLKNHVQEGRVREFLVALEAGDYPAGYSFWGCRVDSPCQNYTYNDFLEDWGPSSAFGKLQSHRFVRSRERGSGVEITMVLNENREVKLWVEKSNGVLGFSPL